MLQRSLIPSAVQEERSSMETSRSPVGDSTGPPTGMKGAASWLEDGGLETHPPTPGGPVQGYLMTGRTGAYLHMVSEH